MTVTNILRFFNARTLTIINQRTRFLTTCLEFLVLNNTFTKRNKKSVNLTNKKIINSVVASGCKTTHSKVNANQPT